MSILRLKAHASAPASLVVAGLLCLTAACAPQAELVKTRDDMNVLREDARTAKERSQELQKRLDSELKAVHKRLETLDVNVNGTLDVQKVMADFGVRADQLATDIQLLQGKLEENNYHIKELAQKLDDRSVKLSELSARMDELEKRMKPLLSGAPSVGAGPTGTEGRVESPVKTVEPSDAYRQAKSDFDRGDFDLALAGFRNYIEQFPDSSQADHAQYWIGECYYAKKDFGKAIEAFLKVATAYPRSEKIPGARLKVGLSYLNEKNTAKAKEYLNKVVREHPDTNEAKIAKDRLAKMQK
jgi:tol-pal system protein YbgF